VLRHTSGVFMLAKPPITRTVYNISSLPSGMQLKKISGCACLHCACAGDPVEKIVVDSTCSAQAEFDVYSLSVGIEPEGRK